MVKAHILRHEGCRRPLESPEDEGYQRSEPRSRTVRRFGVAPGVKFVDQGISKGQSQQDGEGPANCLNRFTPFFSEFVKDGDERKGDQGGKACKLQHQTNLFALCFLT